MDRIAPAILSGLTLRRTRRMPMVRSPDGEGDVTGRSWNGLIRTRFFKDKFLNVE